MSVEIIYRPLDHSTWIHDGRRTYKRCQFRCSYSDTMNALRYELHRLGVRRAVLETDITENEIRLDGMPYANAKPRTPAVRLSFTLADVGPVQYPCDTYTGWQDNIRAIAKTLEAQRAMDRYGATRHRQQYSGWKQLPPAGAAHAPMTLEQAASFVRDAGGGEVSNIIGDPDAYRSAYRRAAKATHPDTNGGQMAADFQRLQEAKRLLDKHHGQW